MKRIIIFASGSGSNAEQIYQYFAKNPNIEISLILSNNPQAGVLERAKRLGIAAMTFNRKMFESDIIRRLMLDINPDLIILAGFLWKFPENIISDFPKKIINIHPSLLPKFGGKGMYGMNVHKAVIDAKEKESGITIHYVNEHYDQGQIIRQEKINILPDDSPESIAQKIHLLEYEYFPKTIAELLDENI